MILQSHKNTFLRARKRKFSWVSCPIDFCIVQTLIFVSYIYVQCPGVMRPTVWYQSPRPSFKQTEGNNTRPDGIAVPEAVQGGTEKERCLREELAASSFQLYFWCFGFASILGYNSLSPTLLRRRLFSEQSFLLHRPVMIQRHSHAAFTCSHSRNQCQRDFMK